LKVIKKCALLLTKDKLCCVKKSIFKVELLYLYTIAFKATSLWGRETEANTSNKHNMFLKNPKGQDTGQLAIYKGWSL